ncbi:MAG: chromosome partitioning protein ParB [Alphaproteobacteria bacterium]|nr:MAG: chromosome partitioning protein ParB [Alphaproteobacteria bacterium]
MKQDVENTKIIKIEINRINILNPRTRNQKVFQEMVENIKRVGLKRPITVTPSRLNLPNIDYDLVCGQGRIKALQLCEQTHIPAIVIYDTEDTILLKSLVENLARRQHRPLDHLAGIKELIKKGYSAKTISIKTGLDSTKAKAMVELLKKGEERLLVAVMVGHLPIRVAMQIATSPKNEQNALHEAYENHELRGEKLKLVQKLLEARKRLGKSTKSGSANYNSEKRRQILTGQDVMNVYHKEVDRKKSLARKALLINRQITFFAEAWNQVCSEPHFGTLLRAEGLPTMPKLLSEFVEENS